MKRFLLIFCLLTLVPCCALDTKTQKGGAYDAAGGAATGIDGRWEGKLPGGGQSYYDFKADGDTLRGTTFSVVSGYRRHSTPIKNGKIEGTNISFTFSLGTGAGGVITFKCTGVLLGDELVLSFTVDLRRSDAPPPQSFVYKRIK